MLQTINCLLLFSALSLEVATGQESWKDRPAVDPSLRVISRSQLVEKKGLLHLKGEKNPFSGFFGNFSASDSALDRASRR